MTESNDKDFEFPLIAEAASKLEVAIKKLDAAANSKINAQEKEKSFFASRESELKTEIENTQKTNQELKNSINDISKQLDETIEALKTLEVGN